MALFRSERGIGRGETAESRLEVPVFALFIVFCSVCLVAVHFYLGNQTITVALAVTMLVFGITFARVDFGVYILVLAMLLSPELEAGRQISGTRSLNIRYDDILIVVIFLGVMLKLAFEGRFQVLQPCPINLGIGLYYGTAVVSSLIALTYGLSAWDERTAFFVLLKMLQFYMVFFLVGQAIRTRKEIRNQLVLFFIVAMIISTYGIYSIGTTPRVSAPFETGGTEPNTLGGYLVVVLCLAFALFTQARTTLYKMLFLGLAGTAFLPFLFTLSRASYGALIVGVLAISILSRRVWLVMAIVGVLLCSPIIMPQEVQDRVAYTFQAESGQDVVVGGRELGVKVDKSTEERLLVWRKVRHILSIGGTWRWFGAGVSWESVLDSQYARVILETGLIGITAFIFMLFTIARTTRQAYLWTDDWMGRGVALGAFGAVLALAVQGFGTISFLIVRIMEPFWFLVALAVIVRNNALAVHWARLRAQRAQQAAAASDTPTEPEPPPAQEPPPSWPPKPSRV